MTLGGGTGGINFTSSTTITNTASSGYTAIYANGGGIYLGGSASVNHLSIASTGAATFSSSVTVANAMASYNFNAIAGTANTYVANFGGVNYGSVRGLTIGTFQNNGGNDCGVEFNAAINNTGYGAFSFKGGTSEYMRITQAGNVGIGTTSPNKQLEISYTSGVNNIAVMRLNSSGGGQNSSIEYSQGGTVQWEVGSGMALTSDYEIRDRVNSINRLSIKQNGNVLIGTTTDNGAKLQVNGNLTANNVTSGTYIPTLSASNNVTSSSVSTCQYMRVGNVVTVSGRISITATSALTATSIRISLPITGNAFTSQDQAGGTGYFQNGSASATCKFYASNATLFTVDMLYYTGATTPLSDFYFSFTYQIL